MALKTVCNMCGKDFEEIDRICDASFRADIGYGSGYDTARFRLDLCCKCCDEFISGLIPHCKVSPISENDTYF